MVQADADGIRVSFDFAMRNFTRYQNPADIHLDLHAEGNVFVQYQTKTAAGDIDDTPTRNKLAFSGYGDSDNSIKRKSRLTARVDGVE